VTTDDHALRDELEFLLASIDDLEREREAGDVDEEDHRRLLDGYTARAARIARLLEDPAPPEQPASRGHRRKPVVAVAVVVAAALSSWFVASSSGQRLPGEQITGLDPRDEVTRLLVAARQTGMGDLEAAVDADPTYPDPYCFLGIIQFRFVGDATTARPLIDGCLAADPPGEVRGLVEGLAAELAELSD
jgi:hypothetical protein